MGFDITFSADCSMNIFLRLLYCVFTFFFKYAFLVESPVIVSFAEKSTPVWAIPFPAVTICPETKTYMNLLNFTDVYNAKRDSVNHTGIEVPEFTEEE